MSTKIHKAHIAGSVLLFILITCSFLATSAAGGNNVSMQITPGPNLNITNHSISTDGQTGDFVAGPTPVTILRVELNQSTLPGPRDMGYGPSVIDLSIAPQILAVIFIIVLIGLVIWFIRKRKPGKIDEEPIQKE